MKKTPNIINLLIKFVILDNYPMLRLNSITPPNCKSSHTNDQNQQWNHQDFTQTGFHGIPTSPWTDWNGCDIPWKKMTRNRDFSLIGLALQRGWCKICRFQKCLYCILRMLPRRVTGFAEKSSSPFCSGRLCLSVD